MKYHLDERVGTAVATGLRKRGIDVSTTPQAGLIGASDSRQLGFAGDAERVVFTQDEDFLILGQKVSHSGIVYCKQGSRSVRHIIDHLELIHVCLTPQEMKNHIEFL
jgi:predicted nuclease of predicted toxin-antitoxin system